ncbi:phiSA1p31-related protein [Streptomyces lateritius]|uniref:phiSA1p31-related protein n=1 Tax=Streptomyces lateritius TaxID=67313 RepID=UPI001C8BA430|nr:phiSA1p31-related protein [Streptomyces lateritius]MBX9425487.1 phiSA1p31-related protein [Streptomyces lateritius]
MTIYLHDGTEFDLNGGFTDVIGVEWTWTGRYSDTGEPLLVGGGHSTPLPLPTVYHDHGPLIPLPKRSTGRLVRAAVSADFTASVRDGHTESYEQYALRTTRASQ